MKMRLQYALLALAIAACGEVSQESEESLGQELAAQVERELPLSNDAPLDAWVDALGARLSRVADSAGRTWNFTVVDRDDLNAFAIPGGHIYIHRGLLARAGDMSEVAGVLGHEIAHVTLRHSVQQMRQRTKANVVVTLFCGITGWCGSDVARAAIQLGGAALFAKYSREDETDADSAAVTYLVAAGIDPAGVSDMFRRISAVRERAPGAIEAFFASHPLDEERIQKTSALVEREVRPGLQRSDTSFSRVQPRLQAPVP